MVATLDLKELQIVSEVIVKIAESKHKELYEELFIKDTEYEEMYLMVIHSKRRKSG